MSKPTMSRRTETLMMKHALTLAVGLAALLALAPSPALAQACIGACTTGGTLCASDSGCSAGTCDGACAPPASVPADGAFTPVECADPTLEPSQDSCGDEARDHRNIVGGGTQPAYLYAQDGEHLYLRLRLEHDPRQADALRAFAWGFGLDADGDGEFEAYVTAIGQGASDRLEIQDQDASNGTSMSFTLGGGGAPNTSLTPANTTGTVPTWVDVRPTTDGNFCVDDTSSTSDFFLTVAVPLAVLADFGALGGLFSYGGSSSQFSGIQNDFVCVEGEPAACVTGDTCPSGVCLETGVCAPPTTPFFIGCLDSTAAGTDSGCTAALPHCIVSGGTSECVECLGTAECDDTNECTTDACVDNACGHLAEPPGDPCTGGVCNGASGAPMCVTCVDDATGTSEDTGCAGATPLCDTSGAAPVCVSCLEDDTGCSGLTPICDRTGTPMCVSCNADAQCDDGDECTSDACVIGTCVLTPTPGATCTDGVCGGDALAPVCIDCVDDSIGGTDTGCDEPTRPFCDTTGERPICVECLGSATCGDGVECTSDLCVAGACANPPAPAGTLCAGGVCDGTATMCVACIDDPAGADPGCGGDAPFCDESGAAPVCVECRSGVDCADGNECTNDVCALGACDPVPIAAGAPCSGGVCDGDSDAPLCVTCVDDAGAGAPDSGCAAGTPYCDDTGGALACVACLGASDCDDGNECTTDTCTGGACGATSVGAGTACSGGVCDGAASDPLCIACIDDATGTGMDSGCTSGAPVCQDLGGVPVCTGCATDADCDDGDECTADACVASACTNDPEPAGTTCGAGVCDGDAAPSCVACVDDAVGAALDTGCAEAAPLCDTLGGTPVCVLCVDGGPGEPDLGCATPLEVCAIAGDARACVDCEDSGADVDVGCMAAAPICGVVDEAPQCLECTADSECPGGDICNAVIGTCQMGCRDDAGCAAPTPVCATDTEMCVECVDDEDCLGRTSCGDGRVCRFPDHDGDGVDDDVDVDDDNDGIPDAAELGGTDASGDTDGDGVPDFEDAGAVSCADADEDGICDTLSSSVDFDGDGVPNHLDLDADGDGLTDLREGGGDDANGDGTIDGFTDLDGNGLDDRVMASPLPLPNTDGTGGPDFLDLDADGDGLSDVREADGTDVDGDGRADGAPNARGIVATVLGGGALPGPDTDGDGAPDWQDVDADGDGVPDGTESTDEDHDGRPDREASGIDTNDNGWDDELDGSAGGTAPAEPDRDDDGTADWRDPDDDGDGVPTVDEDPNGDGDPTNDDGNGDGTPDYLDPSPEISRTGGFSGGALCAASPIPAGTAFAWLLGLAAVVVIRRRRR